MRDWINAHSGLFTTAFVVVMFLILWPVGRFMRRFSADEPRLATPPAPARTPAFAVAVGGVFVLAGLAALISSTVLPMRRVRQAAAWQATPGIVLDSRVGDVDMSPGDAPRYQARIRYRYRVGDADYAGEAYGIGQHTTTDHAVQGTIVMAHPPGSTVTVFYDPAHPANALLDRTLPPLTWLWTTFSVTFVVVGIVVMIVIWRRRPEWTG